MNSLVILPTIFFLLTVNLDLAWPAAPKQVKAETSAVSGSGSRGLNPHQGLPNIEPHFAVYFDLLLAHQPGKAEFSFLNFHPLLFFEIMPSEALQFAFEVRSDPRYFELDYQLNETLQLRAGKIWIPFDDTNPHNLYGGRIGTSRMRLGPDYFLPDIWTDLGVGLKYQLIDEGNFSSDAHLYVVNGIPESSGAPDFQDQSVTDTDNNGDKAVGGRVHFLFGHVFGLGFSAYSGRWSDETKMGNNPRRLSVLGTDFQLRSGNSSVRIGVIGMWADLGNQQTLRRHGEFAEYGHRFGNVWRATARVGNLDTDDSATDVNDVSVVGLGIAYKPSVVQLSLDHQVDIKRVDGKAGYTFTFARVTVQL